MLTPQVRDKSSVWRLSNYWPSTPSTPSECVLPPHQRRGGGGYTLARWWGGGGSIFWKTPDIGLASYSIIPLRLQVLGKFAGCTIELKINLLSEHCLWKTIAYNAEKCRFLPKKSFIESEIVNDHSTGKNIFQKFSRICTIFFSRWKNCQILLYLK